MPGRRDGLQEGLRENLGLVAERLRDDAAREGVPGNWRTSDGFPCLFFIRRLGGRGGMDDVGNHVRVDGCGDDIRFVFLLVSVLLWNVRVLSGEKNSTGESFFDFLMGVNTLCGVSQGLQSCSQFSNGGVSESTEIIGLVEHKRGGEEVHIKGYDIFRADRWDYKKGMDGRSVKLKDGGAMLPVAERLQAFVIRELPGSPP